MRADVQSHRHDFLTLNAQVQRCTKPGCTVEKVKRANGSTHYRESAQSQCKSRWIGCRCHTEKAA